MTDLGGALIAPAVGTILFRVAQLPFRDPDVLTCKQARSAIDDGRKPKEDGKIPLKFFDEVCDYAEGCD